MCLLHFGRCAARGRARELRGACDHSPPPTALEGGNAIRRSMEGGMLTGPTPVRGRDRVLCMHIVGGMWCWVGELAGLHGSRRASRAVVGRVTPDVLANKWGRRAGGAASSAVAYPA